MSGRNGEEGGSLWALRSQCLCPRLPSVPSSERAELWGCGAEAALQIPLGCELASLPDPKAEGDFSCQQVSGVSLALSQPPLPTLH